MLPTHEELVAALGGLDQWAHRCHAASVQLVRSGVFGDTFVRVARGWTQGVFGQHSWVVVGRDCYFDGATVVDPTLWSYDPEVEGIWIGKARDRQYVPHGKGSIWNWGKPAAGSGDPIELTPTVPLSPSAQGFLRLLGPLDRKGWASLAHAPVQGWPAGEIFAAMDDTPGLRRIVPIDRIGMLTDRNPGGLYLQEDS